MHSRPGAAAGGGGGGGGGDRDLPAPPPVAAAISSAVVRPPLAAPDEGDLYDIDEGDEDADGEEGEVRWGWRQRWDGTGGRRMRLVA